MRSFLGIRRQGQKPVDLKGRRTARAIVATTDSVAAELIADNLTELEALDVGNRRLNPRPAHHGDHSAALTKRPRPYVRRRRTEGKSKHEAMRALTRHLSNVADRCLMEDCRDLPGAACQHS